MNNISVSGKKWSLKKFNEEDVIFFKENFFLDHIISKLLSIRGVPREEVELFLNPSLKNILPNPEILKDMNKATNKVFDNISKKKKLGIFGDYDVDGASSTALLGNFFKKINHPYEIYIPDRKTEGYGPSKEGLKKLIDLNVGLIFTVDCGTMSFEPINYANNKQVDIIVLDHHQSEIKLPDAHSIVNPNRYDDESNLKYLCASGVCFMFLISLNKKLREEGWYIHNKIKEPNLLEFLDLVSLGTICDVVPLIGLNRALVKQGLKILNLKKNLGIKALLDICGIETNLSTYHLGYMIGPRINAGGRVGKCSHGANLLMNSEPKKIFQIASELEQFNKERKILESNLLSAVLNLTLEKNKDPVLILDGENWHEGIIGIIASKIKDKFNKPTIIVSTKNGVGKASARSIVGFDIGSAIISAVQKKLLIKGGGHKMAGGFSLKMSNLNDFKKFIFNKFNQFQNKNFLDKIFYIDSEISPSALNINFYENLEKLAPFGSGNPEPRFVIEDLKVIKSKIVGEKHVKSILLAKDGSSISSICFNCLDNEIGQFLINNNKDFFSIVGKLSLNEWKGKKNVEFIIDDISVIKKIKNKVPSSIG